MTDQKLDEVVSDQELPEGKDRCVSLQHIIAPRYMCQHLGVCCTYINGEKKTEAGSQLATIRLSQTASSTLVTAENEGTQRAGFRLTIAKITPDVPSLAQEIMAQSSSEISGCSWGYWV